MPTRTSEPTDALPPDLPPDALVLDGAQLGLVRLEVVTLYGTVVVRASAERDLATAATVLLHGAAGSWTTWTPLLRQAVDDGHPLSDVIAVDLPGWGESPLPAVSDPDVTLLSSMVADVARALGYRSWTVIGHSLGGFVALEVAVNEPTATLAVGLVSGSGAGELAAIRHPLRGGVRLPWFAGMLLAMHALRGLGAAGPTIVRLLQRVGLLGPLMAPFFADRRSLHPSVVHALSEEVRPATFVLAARAAAAYDLQRWRSVGCPVRLVQGRRDVFVGARDLASFEGLVEDFEHLLLDGAGHFAAVEQPRAVLRFFRRSGLEV